MNKSNIYNFSFFSFIPYPSSFILLKSHARARRSNRVLPFGWKCSRLRQFLPRLTRRNNAVRQSAIGAGSNRQVLLGGILRGHPFDLIYNFGLRHIFKSPKLPPYGLPRRFACLIASGLLTIAALGFQFGVPLIG